MARKASPTCLCCGTIRTFTRKSDKNRGLCSTCANEYTKKWARDHLSAIQKRMGEWRKKTRALGLVCDLDEEYLMSIWTGSCAISGNPIDLISGRGQPTTGELDRIIPHLGYVKGNVAWVSHRFNRLKDNGKLSEFEMIVRYLKQIDTSTS